MKSVFNLFSIFSNDIDKKINKYLITHKFEDLKKIDRKKILVAIYNSGKEVVIAKEKSDNAKSNYNKLLEAYNDKVEFIKRRYDSKLELEGPVLERDVTKCEIKKKQLEMAQELSNVLKKAEENKTKKFNELVAFLSEYDAQLEYGAAIMELNKTKVELSKVAEMNINHNSTLLSDINEVGKEYELEFKANQLVEDSLSSPSMEPVQPQSIEDRISRL